MTSKPKVLILSGYGINCETETAYAFKLAGASTAIVHINDLIAGKHALADFDILAFPGGFSYGDDTGSGNAFANKMRNHLWDDLQAFIASEKLIIGICNGFQILTRLGLFAPQQQFYGQQLHSLQANTSNRYECLWVRLVVENTSCVFTKDVERLHIPVAHGEGRFVCSDDVYAALEQGAQIVVRYADEKGNRAQGTYPHNPNGSHNDVAGVCDYTGRIFGLMPHPERALYTVNMPDYHARFERAKREGNTLPKHNESALRLFKNAVAYASKNMTITQSPSQNTSQKQNSQSNSSEQSFTYADAGVNIELGDSVSEILYNAAKQTFDNRKGKLGEIIIPNDDFSGVRAVDVGGLPKGTIMCMGFDGVGTKVEIAQRMNNHRTIAHDLIAMVCDDAIVRGAEPVLVGSVLDVNTLSQDLTALKQLAQGYMEAANKAGVAIINGELAELGALVGGHGDFGYNWSAAVVWFANKDNLFTGSEVKVGDSVIAVRENGFRSNGLSLVRKVFKEVHGENWHTKDLNGKPLGDHVLVPSQIFSKVVTELLGGLQGEPKHTVNGVVHVTGGGVPGKLRRVLKPSGYGAVLPNLFLPCDAMKHCQEVGNIADREAYRTWNMGQGLLLITPEPQKVLSFLNERGYEAKIAGHVTEEQDIVITSQGRTSETIVFDE